MTWRQAVVAGVRAESPSAVRLDLAVNGWPGHVPGQHVDIRLSAEDGYTATRSYSIASAPEEASPALLVQNVSNGEVSNFLAASLVQGDLLEVRGPVGGHFVWCCDLGGPVQLIAGGSGVVPFLSMIGHHELCGSDAEMRLLYAVRGPRDVLGSEVLGAAGAKVDVTYAYSRTTPPGWSGPTGRLDTAALADLVFPPERSPQIFVCGPTGFVENAAESLLRLHHPPESIKTERYGDAT
jgi:ferredoxin-NADP reductase